MDKKNLQKQADKILKIAEDAGLQSNYFFQTTFQRYQVQLQILEELEKTIEEDGMLVKKTYVKGKSNVYENPAVACYNRTTDSANKTVATLMRILKNFDADITAEDVDPLMDMLNVGDDGK